MKFECQKILTKSKSAAISKGSGMVPGALVSRKNENLIKPQRTSSTGTFNKRNFQFELFQIKFLKNLYY